MNKHITLPACMWAFVLLLCRVSPLSAQTEAPTINIQGTLRDASGKSVEDGTYQVTFKLYSVPSDGTPIWQETGAVSTRGGVYSFNLGGTTPLNTDMFGSTVYLGMVFNGFELVPRTEFDYAPYAFASTIAQTVACSGALGDIKYSILNPTQFASVNGDCWVPMNGAALSASSAVGQRCRTGAGCSSRDRNLSAARIAIMAVPRHRLSPPCRPMTLKAIRIPFPRRVSIPIRSMNTLVMAVIYLHQQLYFRREPQTEGWLLRSP